MFTHALEILQDLCDETALKKAREDSGLGTSQTAEVAWLEEQGFTYEEHDVKDFYKFMEEHGTWGSHSDPAPHASEFEIPGSERI